MRNATRALGLALLSGLILAAPAAAKHHAPRHHRPHAHKQHHRHGFHAPSRASVPRLAVALPPTLVGIGNVPGCIQSGSDPTSYLHQYDAQILRVIVDPSNATSGTALTCIQAAAAAGYKVHLAIQYYNSWTPQQTADYFQQVLPQYAPYLWAVSIGNEQELALVTTGTAAEYAATWQAVEPIVAQLAPQAIRVAGEISPWGETFIKTAMALGLPGIQAVAAHPYDASPAAVSELESWCHSLGLPIWFTEGLAVPGSWGGDLPLAQMAGADVADAWLG